MVDEGHLENLGLPQYSLMQLFSHTTGSHAKPNPDLPTPITCKSGGFEKQAQKNLEIKTSNNNDRLFVSQYSLPN